MVIKLSFNTIQHDIELKRKFFDSFSWNRFNTIQHDIELKPNLVMAVSLSRFNTIQHDIELKRISAF